MHQLITTTSFDTYIKVARDLVYHDSSYLSVLKRPDPLGTTEISQARMLIRRHVAGDLHATKNAEPKWNQATQIKVAPQKECLMAKVVSIRERVHQPQQ
jgi:hypothetical protein